MPQLSSPVPNHAILTAAMKVIGLYCSCWSPCRLPESNRAGQPVQTTALNDASQDTALEDANQEALQGASQPLPKRSCRCSWISVPASAFPAK